MHVSTRIYSQTSWVWDELYTATYTCGSNFSDHTVGGMAFHYGLLSGMDGTEALVGTTYTLDP